MNILIWNSNQQSGFIVRDEEKQEITTKPSLSFSFDSLYFEQNNYFKVISDENITLSVEELLECGDYVLAATIITMSHAVNADGAYLGFVEIKAGMTQVKTSPPNGDNFRHDFTSKEWIYAHGVNADGQYLGNTVAGTAEIEVDSAPQHKYERWDFGLSQWFDARTLLDYAKSKIDELDNKAGEVRSLAITTAHGMAGVYVYKAMQAKEYLSDPSPIDADYKLVIAEQTALKVKNPNATMGDAADYILQKEADWILLVSIIEDSRREGKELMLAASTREEVDAAFVNATTNLTTV